MDLVASDASDRICDRDAATETKAATEAATEPPCACDREGSTTEAVGFGRSTVIVRSLPRPFCEPAAATEQRPNCHRLLEGIPKGLQVELFSGSVTASCGRFGGFRTADLKHVASGRRATHTRIPNGRPSLPGRAPPRVPSGTPATGLCDRAFGPQGLRPNLRPAATEKTRQQLLRPGVFGHFA